MATDLVCSGFFSVGGTDVSAEVTLVTLKATAADVVIPPTLTLDTSHAGGAVKYECQIDYLSDDASTGVLFPLLWTAVTAASAEVVCVARFRPGAESPSNPQWTFTMVVSGADVGGPVESLSTGSITCVLTGAPTLNEA